MGELGAVHVDEDRVVEFGAVPGDRSMSRRRRVAVCMLTRGDRSAERRRIKIGRRNIEQVEVLSGLKEGDRVITSD